MKHIKGLDTLRAFAVIFVIIAHWGPRYGDDQPVMKFIIEAVVPDGATGVYIFFTLSGFLITSILLNARFVSGKTNRMLILKNFIIRRTLRIFPIYYIFLFAILHIFNFPDVQQNLKWYLTYTTNFYLYHTNQWNSASHLWTLAIEEQFYLLWPWLMLFVNEKYLKYVFFVAIFTGIITTFFILKEHIEPFMVYNCFDAFSIGGFYSWICFNNKNKQKFEKIIKWIVPILLCVYVGWKIEKYLLHSVENFIFLKKTFESLLTIWLIILIVNAKSGVVKKYFLENHVLNFIGKISYCIYLIHPYFLNFNDAYIEFIRKKLAVHHYRTSEFLTSYTFVYWYNVACLVLVSWLSYILIEQPILKLKKFFKYKTAAS